MMLSNHRDQADCCGRASDPRHTLNRRDRFARSLARDQLGLSDASAVLITVPSGQAAREYQLKIISGPDGLIGVGNNEKSTDGKSQ